MTKPIEFYQDKQGRPYSPPVVRTPAGSITSGALTNSAINAILGYIVSYDGEIISVDGDAVWYKE